MSLELYLKDISRYNLLNPGEEQRLFKRIKNGDNGARERIIYTHLRWVIKVAKEYMKYTQKEEMEDLVAAGNLGLVEAVDRFKPEFGIPFYVYASHWIENEIVDYFRKRGFIRLPSGQERLRSQFIRFKEKYNGRANENREEFYKELSKVLVGQRGKRYSVEEIKELVQKWERVNVLSLNSFVGDDFDREFQEFFSKDYRDESLQEWESQENINHIKNKIQGLDVNPIDIRILEERLFEGKLFGEIGDEFGFSRERARQRYERARKILAKELEKDELFLESVWG